MQRTLFLVCAGNEAFYLSLYLMKWNTTPIGLPLFTGLTYAQAMAWMSSGVCILKNVINVVQLWKASKILVGVDLVERQEMKRQEELRKGQ
jgi:CDP-diacylglycerol--inositol 3-phosphatidyltransferase